MNSAAHCDYCGLPVLAAAPAESGPQYCCYGCRFAAAVMQQDGAATAGDVRAAMTRLGLALFFAMNVMVFTFFLWSEANAGDDSHARVLYELARYICLLLTTPVLFLLGGPLLDDAFAELRRGRASLNLLLMSGVLAAFGYSAFAVFVGRGHVYFEVSCTVLVAVALGRWFEAHGKWKTTAELRRLQKLLPDTVTRSTAVGEEIVALSSVVVGDVLRVAAGDIIAIDGRIQRGEAAIDQCMVTGESAPALKGPGDLVHSGTTNLDGDLYVVATAAPGAGTIERLIEAVLSAVQGRTRLERLAEQLSQAFLPCVLVIATATFAWHAVYADLPAAILNALAVVVISCPCALGLATPMALWAAIGQATRRHILVRDGDAFARLGQVSVYCFDKTGTLTEGCEVGEVQVLPGFNSDRVLSVAAGLAKGSRHPLAEAVARYADEFGVTGQEVGLLRTIAGRGIRGRLDNRDIVLLGSAAWLEDHGIPCSGRSDRQEQATVLLAIDGELAAVFLIEQRQRAGVKEALAALRAGGARTIILSGDSAQRAAAIAARLQCEVQAPLLPEEKLAVIRSLQQQGETVAMVGDGLNDAPALAAADIGIALGCGADVSRFAGNLCLLSDDIASLPWLADLSRRTTRTIRWNLLWAFGYNAVCIPLAAAGYLHPAIAAGAMVISSLLVVTNSLRLAAEDEAPSAVDATSLPDVAADQVLEVA
jgi:heavy metal translocating P-type ATPase